jgi:O-antigen ligase
MNFSQPSFQKLSTYLVFSLIMSLYLPFIFSNIVTIALLILSFYFLVSRKYQIPKAKIYLLSPLFIYFIIYIVALFYTDNLKAGMFILEKRLSFLAFPVIFLPFSLPKKSLHKILKFYILISFVFCCWLLALLVYEALNQETTGFNILTNHELAGLIGFHATYLAMYIGFAFLLALHSLLNEKGDQIKNVRYFLYILIFLLLEILLFARIALIAISIIAGALVISYLVRTRKYKLIIPLIAFVALAFLITLSIPILKERFKEAINYNSEYTIDKQWGGRSMRLLQWACCTQVIEKAPLLGVSPGDAQDVLDQCYKDNKFAPLYHWPNTRFNAHNQYLQELIHVGIFGILPFIGAIVIQGLFAFRRKEHYHLLFLALFTLVCVTESVLGLNKGIVFFTFFSCLFSSSYFHVIYHKT